MGLLSLHLLSEAVWLLLYTCRPDGAITSAGRYLLYTCRLSEAYWISPTCLLYTCRPDGAYLLGCLASIHLSPRWGFTCWAVWLLYTCRPDGAISSAAVRYLLYTCRPDGALPAGLSGFYTSVEETHKQKHPLGL